MLVRVAALAALGGFLFGYDLGLIGGAMLGISQAFNITSNSTKQAIVGAAKLGAFFGTFIGGVLMLRYGRRLAIAFEAGFFVLGPVIMASATGPGGLIVGRLVVGLGVGASAIVVPAYLAEIAPAVKRGAVVQTYEMMLTLGMLCAGVIDWVLSTSVGPSAWRWMVGLPAAPGALLLVSLAVLPESPRWLVLRGQLDLALATLHRIIQSTGSSSGRTAAEQSVILASESQAIAKAEDELLLLWSSVQKEQAAGLMLRQQRQQQMAATAAVGRANMHAHMNGDSGHQQAAGYQPPHANAESAAVQTFAPAAAPSNVFTLDEPADSAATAAAGVVVLDSNDVAAPDPGGAEAAAAGGPDASDADRLGGVADDVDAADESRRTTISVTDVDSMQQQPGHQYVRHQHQQHGQYQAADDSQFEELLSHHHHSSSGAGDRHRHKAAAGAPTGVTAGAGAAGFLAWVKGWLRGSADLCNDHGTDGSAAVHDDDSQQQHQQCEPGQEANVCASLWAMLADIVLVMRGPERAAFAIAASLAVFNQATASTAVINYTPEVLSSVLGVTEQGSAILYPAVITVTKCVGVAIALLVVDAWGRKPLLMWGGAGCGAALLLAGLALAVSSVSLFLACLCLFIFSFSVSWAGLYWVVVSEIFSMGAKSPATSAATSLLFLTGSIVDFVFLSLVGWLGAGAFGLFAAVAFASGWYVYRSVPETKGRTLVEIQALLAAPAADAVSGTQVSGGVVRYGRWRGWDWGRTTAPATTAAAAIAAARASAAGNGQSGESTPLQQQQESRQEGPGPEGRDTASPRGPQQNGTAAVGSGRSSVDSLDSGDQSYWQHWMRQQQQQSSSGGGMSLPLGLELQAVGGRGSRQHRPGRQAENEALINDV